MRSTDNLLGHFHMQRVSRDMAMNERAVRRGQPKAARCLRATPSLSDPFKGHAKPISREAFKKKKIPLPVPGDPRSVSGPLP